MVAYISFLILFNLFFITGVCPNLYSANTTYSSADLVHTSVGLQKLPHFKLFQLNSCQSQNMRGGCTFVPESQSLKNKQTKAQNTTFF